MEGTDFSKLHDRWNPLERHYELDGRSVVSEKIVLDGQPCDVKIEEIDFSEDAKIRGAKDIFPTSKRLIVQVAPKLNSPHDVVVPVFFGWGETSAQFEGDALEILLRELKNKGYVNPKIIEINISGRGTREYIDNQDQISRADMTDEINDVRCITRHLMLDGHFDVADVILISHSRGAMDGLAALDELHTHRYLEGMRRVVNTSVKSVIQFMPATDRPGGFLNQYWLLAVSPYIGEAIRKSFLGKGSMLPTEEEHGRMMFAGSKFSDRMHYERGVPASARSLLGMTIGFARRFEEVLNNAEIMRGVDVKLIEGANDVLLPPEMFREWNSYLAARLQGRVERYTLEGFQHSIPFEMSELQRDRFSDVLAKSIPEKRIGAIF